MLLAILVLLEEQVLLEELDPLVPLVKRVLQAKRVLPVLLGKLVQQELQVQLE